MVDDFVAEFVMPAAPEIPVSGFRRFKSGTIISGLAAFALLSVSIIFKSE